MYSTETAIKSLSKRRQYSDERAIEAIREGRYVDAARYLAESTKCQGAMDEIAFMVECEEVE